MTYSAIRSTAKDQAYRFARAINEGRGADAAKLEDTAIATAQSHLGGNFHQETKQQYFAKCFVLACRERGVSTRMIHLCKNGEVK